jgi:hypothetical protein
MIAFEYDGTGQVVSRRSGTLADLGASDVLVVAYVRKLQSEGFDTSNVVDADSLSDIDLNEMLSIESYKMKAEGGNLIKDLSAVRLPVVDDRLTAAIKVVMGQARGTHTVAARTAAALELEEAYDAQI